jgi:sugar/nucleoside kinase (ribokinase family)
VIRDRIPTDLATGAGDVFLGSLSYSIWKGHSEEKMLSLASFIAAMKCRDIGIKAIPTLAEVPKELL